MPEPDQPVPGPRRRRDGHLLHVQQQSVQRGRVHAVQQDAASNSRSRIVPNVAQVVLIPRHDEILFLFLAWLFLYDLATIEYILICFVRFLPLRWITKIFCTFPVLNNQNKNIHYDSCKLPIPDSLGINER